VAGDATYRVLVSSAVRSRLRPALAALLLASGLALSACGSATPESEGGHHHSGPATVEGADDTYAGIDLAEPYRRPSFTLTDTTGAAFDFTAATSGRPTLLFFGFTNCPDVCPTTLLDMSSDLAALGDKADALDDLCDSRPRARHTRRAAGISRLVRSEDHGADRPARIDSTTTRKAG
jgi:hypothetical protein